MADTPAAARVGDPVTHSAALWGTLQGALIGAALGAILVASGGTAAPLLIAGAMATGASLGGAVGKVWGQTQVVACGAVLTGSPNVSVNGRPAAFVGSQVSCNQHPGPQTVVEGSGSVEINGKRSARVGDRCSCGCVIAPAGSPDTRVGGPAVMPAGAAAREVPLGLDVALFALGLGGGGALLRAGGAGAAVIAAKLGGSLVGGEAGRAGGRALGGRLYGEGTRGQMVLGIAGSLVGGMGGDLGAGAAARAAAANAATAARAAEQAAIRTRVMDNLARSQRARASSNFEAHLARLDQQRWGYNPDTWTVTTLPAGTRVYGGLPGQSAYYTSPQAVQAAGGSRATLFRGLQVRPHATFGYRPEVGVYEVVKDTRAATGSALANPQLGAGGAEQFFMSAYGSRLRLVDRVPLGP